jgi:hypothetical protein
MDVDAVETRQLLKAGAVSVWAIDSASLACADDNGTVLITGSHGGLLGGNPRSALKADAWIAAFNDAGGGRYDAGFTRLPALDRRGIAAVTVDVFSAEIGNGLSTYETGVISRVNDVAGRLGASAGTNLREFVDDVLRSHRPLP